MIAFVVQNETHALNFSPVIHELLKRGVSEKSLRTLHLDTVFGMHTVDLIRVPNQELVEIDIPEPYYRLDHRRRFYWLTRNSHKLVKLVEGVSVLVVGSDGGIQRLLANSVRKSGGKVVLLLDGLLHPWPVKNRAKYIVKRELGKLLTSVYLNYLFPADVGHSGLDWIFVMNSYVKSLLTAQGVKTPIEVISLPRFDNYLSRFDRLRSRHAGASKHLLYATGAYKWHGLYRESKFQEQDITDLVDFANIHTDWRVRIRIHPRENKRDYSREWPVNIEVSGSPISVLEDLAWASVLVTARSTIAFEAEIVSVPVLIYTRNFGDPGSDSYFGQNDYFLKSSGLSVVTASMAWLDTTRLWAGESEISCVSRIADVLLGFMEKQRRGE